MNISLIVGALVMSGVLTTNQLDAKSRSTDTSSLESIARTINNADTQEEFEHYFNAARAIAEDTIVGTIGALYAGERDIAALCDDEVDHAAFLNNALAVVDDIVKESDLLDSHGLQAITTLGIKNGIALSAQILKGEINAIAATRKPCFTSRRSHARGVREKIKESYATFKSAIDAECARLLCQMRTAPITDVFKAHGSPLYPKQKLTNLSAR